ncbi:MAG: hypothetical protein MRJ96_13415 [Nitrospirales bacterium]|nr:hypothetical protein [Nitrospira sp.]MDR4502443.1 hypothetical protein [Nitrospirales bacterium]
MFQEALTFIARRLDEAKAQGLVEQYALIGGFAVSAWGIPRATHDVDFAVALGTASPTALSLYLNAEFHIGDSDDPLRGVYHLGYATKGLTIPIQLILLPTEWTRIIVANVVELSILDNTVPVISWQVLTLLKLYAGGPQDLLDAQQIIRARQPSQEDLDTIALFAARVKLSHIWQSFTERISP